MWLRSMVISSSDALERAPEVNAIRTIVFKNGEVGGRGRRGIYVLFYDERSTNEDC